MAARRSPVSVGSKGRRALVAGGSGLVGSALLELLSRLTSAADAADPAGASAVYRSIDALRRKPGAAGAAALVRWHTAADFCNLPALPPVDDVYIALGTTIKDAGSQDAFRQVDFDAVVAVAQAARLQGARRLAVVSALGADARSAVFYNRVKGEMEAALTAIAYETLVIARPSLLLGDRRRLGQADRPAERWGARLAGTLRALIPSSVRPIEASTVAAAMVRAMTDGRQGVSILSSRDLQRLGG